MGDANFQERGSLFAPPTFDPSDYETVEEIAAVLAPIFEVHGWTWASVDGTPQADEIAKTIEMLYARFRDSDPVTSSQTGRIQLDDQNPHDGSCVLYEGVRVLLDVGELPPVRGDRIECDHIVLSREEADAIGDVLIEMACRLPMKHRNHAQALEDLKWRPEGER